MCWHTGRYAWEFPGVLRAEPRREGWALAKAPGGEGDMQQVGAVGGGRQEHSVISLRLSTHRSRCRAGNDLHGGENRNRKVDGKLLR